MKLRRLRENRAPALGRDDRPDKQPNPGENEKRRGKDLEPLDRVHSPNDNENVDCPENEKTKEFTGRNADDRQRCFMPRVEPENDRQHRMDRRAPDPGLDAKPTASD